MHDGNVTYNASRPEWAAVNAEPHSLYVSSLSTDILYFYFGACYLFPFWGLL